MKDLVLDIIGYMWSWFGEDTVNRDVERVLDAEYRKVGYMDGHVPIWWQGRIWGKELASGLGGSTAEGCATTSGTPARNVRVVTSTAPEVLLYESEHIL